MNKSYQIMLDFKRPDGLNATLTSKWEFQKFGPSSRQIYLNKNASVQETIMKLVGLGRDGLGGSGGSGGGAIVIHGGLPETKTRPKESDSDDFHFSDSEGALRGADLGPQNPCGVCGKIWWGRSWNHFWGGDV